MCSKRGCLWHRHWGLLLSSRRRMLMQRLKGRLHGSLHIRLTVKHEGLSRRGWKLLPWWRKMPYICRWLTEWWNSHWPWRWQVNPNRSLSCKSWVIKSLLGSRDRLWEIWLWSCSWLVESWLRPRVWLVKTRLVYSWWVKWWLWGRLIEPRRGT